MNLRSRNPIIFLFGIFCFLFAEVNAQFSNLKFESYSTLEGLSSSTCEELFQDSDGYLWFGTIDGLNRYDGYTFEIFRPVLNDNNSISNNRINSIVEDGDGNLWIGTSNGLNIFQKQKEIFFRIPLFYNQITNANSRDIVNDLHYDKRSNTLWIATNNGISKLFLEGVDRSAYQDLSFKHYSQKINNNYAIDNVTTIVEDLNGKIWIATDGEYLNSYNFEKDIFERKTLGIPLDYSFGHIPNLLLVDSDGDIWIGNDASKLVVWNRKTDKIKINSYTKTPTSVFHLYQDNSGLIWIATRGNGIYLVDKVKGLKQHIEHNPEDPFSLPNNQPSKILEDKDGIFWIATYNKGVSKLDLSKSSFGHHFHQPGNINSLSTFIAQSVLEDRKNRIWVGTDGGGLNLFDEKENSYKHYHSDAGNPRTISSDKILYLVESYDNSIWVCTWDGGLNMFNPDNGNSKRYMNDSSDPYSIGQNTVWCAVEDSLHRLWLGTQNAGLNVFDPNTEKFYSYYNRTEDSTSLISNFVFSTFIDSRNRLFVGTSLGLCVVYLSELTTYIPERIEFKTIKEKNLQGYRINYIYEDQSGNIWVGSDLGLHKLSNNLSLLQSYSINEGLPNNLVLGITEDDEGYIWSTTKYGLSRLNPETNEFKNFNIYDGLQGLEFQSKSIDKTEDGRILVGGINGFNLFNPEDLYEGTGSTKPVFTQLRLNNQIVQVGDTINGRVLLNSSISDTEELVLKYNERNFGIEYVALHYRNPESVQYAYRIIGLDDEYIIAGSNRLANYSNLSPGEYVFEVKSSSDGDWQSANGAILNLSVLPPPWRTWWAYLIYSVVLAAIFWFGIKYYTKIVHEEKEHELDQQKLQFFINVSHEFRTPLTLILNPIDRIISCFDDPEEVKDSAITIQRSARRLLNLVNELLDFRKLDLGKDQLQMLKADILKFSKDIYLLFKNLAKEKDITINFQSSLNELSVLFDPDKYEKILTNLLSNAIKYTDPGGSVTLSIARTKQSALIRKLKVKEALEIRVIDTGVGFKKEQLADVFNRFFHVDSSKTGTGIGLNFTKSLVELHGGEILVESEFQKGSTFIVHLPLEFKMKKSHQLKTKLEDISDYKLDLNSLHAVEYEMSTANHKALKEIETTIGEAEHGNRPVILIVEDNKELRVHLRKELGQSYKVRDAVNGVEGLGMVKKYFPDIIISDVMMPEMDGFEMCSKIKSEIETCHIPIILLTARSLEEDRIEGFRTGADEYIPKPFNISVLKARINNLLEMKKRLREKFASIGGIIPSSDITSNTLDETFLDNTTRIILANISEPDFSLDQLLKELGCSRSHFYRKINTLTGQNPSYFIRTVRLKHASELLIKGDHSIKEIAYMAGFNSTAYFSKTFRELFGMTPNEYAKHINYGSK